MNFAKKWEKYCKCQKKAVSLRRRWRIGVTRVRMSQKRPKIIPKEIIFDNSGNF